MSVTRVVLPNQTTDHLVPVVSTEVSPDMEAGFGNWNRDAASRWTANAFHPNGVQPLYGRLPNTELTVDPMKPDEFKAPKRTVSWETLHGQVAPMASAGANMNLNEFFTGWVNPFGSEKIGANVSAYGEGVFASGKWAVARYKRDGRTRYWCEPVSTRTTIPGRPPGPEPINPQRATFGSVKIPKNADVRGCAGFVSHRQDLPPQTMSHGDIVFPQVYGVTQMQPYFPGKGGEMNRKGMYVAFGQPTRMPITRVFTPLFDNRDALETNPYVHKYNPRERFIDAGA